MTLLERTQSLEARAKRQREHEAREVVAKSIRARTKNLERLLEQLEAARSRTAALQSAGYEHSPWSAPPLRTLAAYDSEETSPLSVESTRQAEWEKFVLALGELVKKAEKAVDQDVKRAKKKALEGISTEDLRGYQDDPSTEKQARRVLEVFERLGQQSWEALSGSELLDVLQRASAFREDVVRLRETGASEELLQFLALARKDGAPLAALTAVLRAELETRKLLGRLRLIVK